jgi:hypothetical protein
MVVLTKSKLSVPLSPKPGSIANQIHAWMVEDALKPQISIIAFVNPTGKDKHAIKKVSEINFDQIITCVLNA